MVNPEKKTQETKRRSEKQKVRTKRAEGLVKRVFLATISERIPASCINPWSGKTMSCLPCVRRSRRHEAIHCQILTRVHGCSWPINTPIPAYLAKSNAHPRACLL
ncbi:hypothetical protein ACLOJK_011126 [Asimina triloba]